MSCLRLWKHRSAFLCTVPGSFWKCIDVFKARQDSCCVDGWDERGLEGKGRHEECPPVFLPWCFISVGDVHQVSPLSHALARSVFWDEQCNHKYCVCPYWCALMLTHCLPSGPLKHQGGVAEEWRGDWSRGRPKLLHHHWPQPDHQASPAFWHSQLHLCCKKHCGQKEKHHSHCHSLW